MRAPRVEGVGLGNDRNWTRIIITAVAITAAVLLLPPLALFLIFVVLVRALKGGTPEPVRSPIEWGSCTVTPGKVTSGGQPAPVTIAYTVGPGGVPRGGAVRLSAGKVLRLSADAWQMRLQWGSGWGSLQRKDASRDNYVEVRSSRDGVELSVSMIEKAMDRAQLAWLKRKFLQKLGRRLEPMDPRDAFLANCKITARVVAGSLSEGDVVEFVLGAGGGLRPPAGSLGTDLACEVDRTAGGDFDLDASFARLEAVGGEPAVFEVVAPTLVAPGERFRVLVRCVDARGLLTPELAGPLDISYEGAIGGPDTVIMVERGKGAAWFAARAVRGGVGRVRVSCPGRGVEGVSNPIASRVCGYRVLWGDLHTHSVVSDGTQEPTWLYHRARDLRGWDFTAVSDHDTWSFGEERVRTPEELELMMRAADDNYRPGEFVTFRTYEWTNHHRGHRNVLFGPGETPVFLPHTDDRYSTPSRLLAELAGHTAMVVPHHCAWKLHAGEMRFDFGPRDDSEGEGAGLQRLVEVYSHHGNSEFYGCPRPISHLGEMEGARGAIARAVLGHEYAGRKSGSYVRDALAAGHRLGLVAGSDEHISGGDPRHAPAQLYGGGITGIFATSHTRQAAWRAMWDRRVCGTTGPRMLMEFSVNGVPHGAEIASRNAHVTGHVIGEAGLELAELIKYDSAGYRSVWQEGGKGPEAVIDWTDSPLREPAFFYLRVVQQDGHMGWAGPTWVDLPK